jgi:DHA1 family tetracycline resistance protein-like MFS transporter
MEHPPAAPQAPIAAGRKSRQASVIFVLITLGIDAFGVGVVIPVLPELVRHLSGHAIANASIWVAILVSAYAFAQFLAAPVLGGLSDRFGRRPVILMSVSGICINYILLAVAPSLGWILIGRLLAGATAANSSAAAAYIADITPPELRAKRFGLIGATFGLGFVLGPAIGGLIGGYALRGPFILSAVMAGLNALYGVFVLPESLPPERRRPFDWRRANPVGSLLTLFADGFLARLALAWSGLWFGICVLQAVFVLYTGIRFHWGALANGAAFALVGLSQALVQSLLVQRVVARLGEARTALLGCALDATAFVLFAFAPTGWFMVLPILVQAAGSIAAPAVRAMLSAHVGPARQGEVQGATSSIEGLTQIAAPLLAGSLFGAFSRPGAPLHFPGIPFLLGAATYLLAFAFIAAAARWSRRQPPAAPASAAPASAAVESGA